MEIEAPAVDVVGSDGGSGSTQEPMVKSSGIFWFDVTPFFLVDLRFLDLYKWEKSEINLVCVFLIPGS